MTEEKTGTDTSEVIRRRRRNEDVSVPAFSCKSGASPSSWTRIRLRILVVTLTTVCLAYSLIAIDQWRLKRELKDIAADIVDEYNESDPIEEGEEPQTETDCTITITRTHLIVGQATGKISFDIAALESPNGNVFSQKVSANPFAPQSSEGTLDHVYIREKGEWKFQDSWFCAE
jgi:hypothetical protein